MKFNTFSLLINIILVSVILWTLPLAAKDSKSTTQSTGLASTKVISETERAKVDDQVNKKEKEIINEAVAAINKTKEAVNALKNEKKQEASEALEDALGELEIVLAREPSLAFAPVDTHITIHHLNPSLADIELARKQAIDYLKDKEIQKARAILTGLASEVVLSVTSIPLATYPDVIKRVIPLIDANKLENAQAALQTALNSLTVINYVFPLPIIRADEILENAQALTKKTNRTNAENEALVRSIGDARLQLETAEALGYGNQDNYRVLYERLDTLEERIGGNAPGTGYFEEIRNFISDYMEPFDKE